MDGGGVRVQCLCRHHGALGAAQDRSGAHGGGAWARSSLPFARSPSRLRRSSRARPTRLLTLIDSRARGRPDRPAAAHVPAARASRGRGRGGVRLIDSHCHLNYEGLVERQDEVLENARERGVAGFLNISTRQSEWSEIVAAAEPRARRLGQRRRPSARGRRPSRPRRRGAGRGRRPSARDRHRRVRPRLLLRQVRPRARSASGSRRISTPRAQTGLPLVVHTRDAEEDTAEILGRAVRERGVTGVLHCFTGSRRAGAQGPRSRLLRLAVGHRDVQERRATCRRSRNGCRRTSMLVETDSPFLAPGPAPRAEVRAGLRRRHRRLRRRAAGRGARRSSPRRRPPISSNCSEGPRAVA